MLVLSRKSNESIVIGDQIVIEILEISNNKIRIGIAAPANVRVVRGELTPKAPLQSRVDSVTGKNDGQLPRLRRTGSGSSGNPGVRTVADAARHRLRQLRQQLNPGAAGLNSAREDASELATPVQTLGYQRTESEASGRTDGHKIELVGQEVAESAQQYRVCQSNRDVKQQGERRSLTASEDDRSAHREVYWQVEALNQYRSEWAAETDSWYEPSVATA